MSVNLRNKRPVLAGVAIVLSAIGGCTFAPRNNDHLAHSTSSFTWAGATPVANQVVFVEVFDNTTSSWSNSVMANAAALTSSSVWQTDAVGTNWFDWVNTITAPNSPQLWKTSSAHTLRAQLRTKQLDVISGNTTMLAMFDAGDAANQCMSANQSGGGVQIITACRNPDPNNVVNMFAPCGTLAEACCDGQCDSGMTCDGASRTSLGLCKESAGSTCTADADCVSGTSCKSGVCSKPCTIGSSCTANATGECAHGTVTGCTPTAPICSPSSPTTEVCDNKDNDCDGTKDNHVASTSCTNGSSDRPTSEGCPVGRVHGRTTCTVGRTVCQFNEGGNTPDYCTINGPRCGDAQGESGPPCIPGSTAVNGRCGPTACSPLNCWLPSDVNNSKVVCPPQG